MTPHASHSKDKFEREIPSDIWILSLQVIAGLAKKLLLWKDDWRDRQSAEERKRGKWDNERGEARPANSARVAESFCKWEFIHDKLLEMWANSPPFFPFMQHAYWNWPGLNWVCRNQHYRSRISGGNQSAIPVHTHFYSLQTGLISLLDSISPRKPILPSICNFYPLRRYSPKEMLLWGKRVKPSG